MDTEVWQQIPGAPNYDVSNHGRVRSWCRPRKFMKGTTRSDRPRLMRLQRSDRGYYSVGLFIHAVVTRRRVHQLVLEAFVGPCPPGMETRHLDGDRGNNRLGNLAWGTKIENSRDRDRHGTTVRGERHPSRQMPECLLRGERHPGARLTEEQALAALGSSESRKVLAARFNVSLATIHDLKGGRSWLHLPRPVAP